MFIQNNIFNAAVKLFEKDFILWNFLQKWAEPIHFGISRGLEKLEVRYKSLQWN